MYEKKIPFNKILVTGGCGFIGSNFIRYILSKEKDVEILNFDSLTYAGNMLNLSDFLKDDSYVFLKGDIANFDEINQAILNFKPDAIVNFAAESHVDRSIDNPNIFFETNVKGTLNLLQSSLHNNVNRFLQVSTDEVYGSLGKSGTFTEQTNINPNSPYSASKASADFFVRSFNKTYNLDTVITRCSNNYGPYQFPEKLIPLVISRIINNEKIPVYGDGMNVRDWIFVLDHCEGILSALVTGKAGEIFNFGGDTEISNISLVTQILEIMNGSESLIEFVEDRKGHDFRYSVNFDKASSLLSWSPKTNFKDGLQLTIDWYLDNEMWLQSILSGDYLKFH